MIKWIFLKLLKHYSFREDGRIEILKVLDDSVQCEYSEQSLNGNVYNFFIEFIISNKWIIERLEKKDYTSIDQIKTLINKGYDAGLEIIEDEILPPLEEKDEL